MSVVSYHEFCVGHEDLDPADCEKCRKVLLGNYPRSSEWIEQRLGVKKTRAIFIQLRTFLSMRSRLNGELPKLLALDEEENDPFIEQQKMFLNPFFKGK